MAVPVPCLGHPARLPGCTIPFGGLMKRTAVALAALMALALPAMAPAQISVGARAGTLGLGGEVSFGVNRMLAIRGGIGAVPYEYNNSFEGVDYTVMAPERIWSVGVDVYP